MYSKNAKNNIKLLTSIGKICIPVFIFWNHKVFSFGDFFIFTDSTWIEVISPRNGDHFVSGHSIPVNLQIGVKNQELRILNETHLEIPVSTDRIESNLKVPFAGELQAPKAKGQSLDTVVTAYCTDAKLNSQNCNLLLDKAIQAVTQYNNSLILGSFDYTGNVCIALNFGESLCKPLQQIDAIHILEDLSVGEHFLEAWISGWPGDKIIEKATSRFVIEPDCAYKLSIRSPLHGSSVPLGETKILFSFLDKEGSRLLPMSELPEDLASSHICFSANAEELGCPNLSTLQVLQPRTTSTSEATFVASLVSLESRRINLLLWHNQSKNTSVCEAAVSFEVLARAPWSGQSLSEFVVVTAASDSYITEERLQNLIGSIHFWEPNLRIVFYDLGISEESFNLVGRLENVEIRKLPENTLPSHLYDSRTYAFKPWVINDALQYDRRVLWIDANVELRRPLDEIRDIFYKQTPKSTTLRNHNNGVYKRHMGLL